MRVIGNIIWLLFGGIITAIGWALAGFLFYITIIGIPLGRQAFKMASLTLSPFGKTITYGGGIPSALANIVWVVIIGFWEASAYAIAGCLFCVTIVAFPLDFSSLRWRNSRSFRLELPCGSSPKPLSNAIAG